MCCGSLFGAHTFVAPPLIALAALTNTTLLQSKEWTRKGSGHNDWTCTHVLWEFVWCAHLCSPVAWLNLADPAHDSIGTRPQRLNLYVFAYAVGVCLMRTPS